MINWFCLKKQLWGENMVFVDRKGLTLRIISCAFDVELIGLSDGRTVVHVGSIEGVLVTEFLIDSGRNYIIDIHTAKAIWRAWRVIILIRDDSSRTKRICRVIERSLAARSFPELLPARSDMSGQIRQRTAR
jgi:hypothetical protein